MKKIIFIFSIAILLIISLSQLCAESNNPHYDKFLELKQQAEEANEAGEYDKAYELSQQAEAELELAKEYRAKMLAEKNANELFKKATDRITYIETSGLSETHKDEYDSAKENYDIAKTAHEEGDYEKSAEYSQKVLDALRGIAAEEGTESASLQTYHAGGIKPKYYVVRLILPLRDCLWNIAAYDFVYGDGSKWGILYEANKNKLFNPNNPDLIHPGTIIEIPELEGEKREGTYDPGQ